VEGEAAKEKARGGRRWEEGEGGARGGGRTGEGVGGEGKGGGVARPF